jgi:hypothetical protein
MTTFTLLTKIYSTNQRKQVENIIQDLFEGLSVEATVKGTPTSNWIQVSLEGEDDEVAKNLLNREFGFCPTTLENATEGAVLKGFVTNLAKSSGELQVDVGVFEPKLSLAAVPLSYLQSKLAGDKKVPLKEMAEAWGICENLPVAIKVTGTIPEENHIEAEFAPEQLERFQLWRDSLLDRLLVLGSSKEQVKAAVEHAGLDRDVIDFESLGMFEHALVCKLGTDAAGLIGRLGRKLWKAKFTVFNPKRIEV